MHLKTNPFYGIFHFSAYFLSPTYKSFTSILHYAEKEESQFCEAANPFP